MNLLELLTQTLPANKDVIKDFFLQFSGQKGNNYKKRDHAILLLVAAKVDIAQYVGVYVIALV